MINFKCCGLKGVGLRGKGMWSVLISGLVSSSCMDQGIFKHLQAIKKNSTVCGVYNRHVPLKCSQCLWSESRRVMCKLNFEKSQIVATYHTFTRPTHGMHQQGKGRGQPSSPNQ